MFSEMVDSVVTKSGRIDKIVDIVDYVNTAFRECQTTGEENLLFWRDLVEDKVPCAATNPTIWTPGVFFRALSAVQYPDGSFPQPIPPGKAQSTGFAGVLKDAYWYAASTYVVFQGPGTDTTQSINVAYYNWFPRLKYYEAGKRPAVYDYTLGTFTYFDLTSFGDLNYTLVANQPTAEMLVGNWALQRYKEVVENGSLAKLYLAIKDLERNPPHYAMFVKGMQQIKGAEAFVSVGDLR